MKFPIQIQADNHEAADAVGAIMCHVFDAKSSTGMCNALSRQYLHVIAWDADRTVVFQYDNR